MRVVVGAINELDFAVDQSGGLAPRASEAIRTSGFIPQV